MVQRVIVLSLFLMLPNQLSAQEYLSGKDQASQHTKKVMEYIANYNFNEAFSMLAKYWHLPQDEILQLESQASSQFEAVAERFGKVIGHDFIKGQTIKDFVLQETHVLRFEQHMIRFVFTYYRNNQGWILNGVIWDDQIDNLFDN